MDKDERLDQLTGWVRQLDGLEDAEPVPASSDASFRRYFRVQGHDSYIVMDAPPSREDGQRFITIAGYLRQMGLNSPDIVEADPDRGFLLLGDLGSVQYLDRLESTPDAGAILYGDAIEALITLQSAGRKYQHSLPPYDEKLLRFELSIFREWLYEKHLGLTLSSSDEARWTTCCDALVERALDQPKVFVHRDFHSRNLMVVDDNNPGILDFQDALEGPYTYDLVSLLKDCYIQWPEQFRLANAIAFFERCGRDNDLDRFRKDFDWMGAQRHLKAAGLFARLLHRDGRDGYLKDIPRTLGYVSEIVPMYPELEFLAELIDERVLPALPGAAS
jgi:aminoglycoside/choline kinase family phosphotransferase